MIDFSLLQQLIADGQAFLAFLGAFGLFLSIGME